MSRPPNVQRPSAFLRAAVAGLLAVASLHASAALVTSRGALAGNDFIDWGQLGASFTETAGPVVAASTNLGLNVSVSKPSGKFLLFDEVGFGGNLGGNILYTNFTPGPISIDFPLGLSKIGAQIQANDFGPFMGVISVYDNLNLLLETWGFSGDSNGDNDNSAIFIGVARSTDDIDRVEFNITGPANLDFAINRVDLRAGVGNGNPNPVPEPETLALVGLALAGVLCSRRRPRS